MTTKNKVAAPGQLTFQYAKTSDNVNNKNYLKVQVSTTGNTKDWTEVERSKDNSQLSEDTFEELNVDLSAYQNVYIRIQYVGAAGRAIDNIVLTMAAAKQPQTLYFPQEAYDLTLGTEEYNKFTKLNVMGAQTEVTYKSSNENVVYIKPTTGDIILSKTAGTATITAMAKEAEGYESGTAECVINICEPFANILQAKQEVFKWGDDADEPSERYLTFKDAVVTRVVDANQVYLQDKDGVIIYRKENHNLNVGDTFNGFAKITLRKHYGLAEIIDFDASKLTKTTTIPQPKSTNVGVLNLMVDDQEFSAELINAYVAFEELAKVSEVDTDNHQFTVKVGENEEHLVVRVNDNALQYEVGDMLRLKGFVGNKMNSPVLDIYSAEDAVKVQPLKMKTDLLLNNEAVFAATFYNANINVVIPTGVKAYTVRVTGANVKMNEFLNEGEVLNAGTPVVLLSTKAFDGGMDITEERNDKATPANDLRGAADNNEIKEAGKRHYVLNYDAETLELGFYFQKSNPTGDKITNLAGKAYLVLDAAQAPAQGLRFSFDDTVTGIAAPTLGTTAPLYDLLGRRASRTAKGIFIQNGQKIIR